LVTPEHVDSENINLKIGQLPRPEKRENSPKKFENLSILSLQNWHFSNANQHLIIENQYFSNAKRHLDNPDRILPLQSWH
jgi:hypothetical protein